MNVTIKEVAKEAEVSVATVSRVLNGSERVRPGTRERVLETAEALHYVPNETARSLLRNETHTVGVLLPDMHGEFFAQVIRGIEQTARAEGYHLLVSSSHSEEQEARTMIRAMLGRVDGLIIMWPRQRTRFFAHVIPDQLPTVVLNAPGSDDVDATFRFDNRGGTRAVVSHLIEEHGHRRVAMVGGASENYDARERLAGYRSVLEEAGIAWNTDYVVEGDFTRETGYAAADELLALSPRPTAIFAANDSMAIGILRRLHELGIVVPQEMALAGFDDIPTARFMTPGLTTVRVPMSCLGERAMRHLLAAFSGTSDGPEHGTLPTELIRRASCGCGNRESESL